jgi:hypothetical protein
MDFRTWLENEDDYRVDHQAPGTDAAPLHNLTQNGIYPADIYGPMATRYYGHGEDAMNRVTISIIQAAKGKPDMRVTIYRAVPKVLTHEDQITDLEKQKAYILKYGRIPPHAHTSLERYKYYDQISAELERLKATVPAETQKIQINPGDWVTINRAYAVLHGRSQFAGQYRILSKTVPARTVFTNGDSIHEWGYWV